MARARLGAIACSNGLGHVKRQVQVLDRLGDLEVTLLCAAWQIDRLRGWAPFDRLGAVEVVDSPLRWYADPARYGEWLTDWHVSMDGWGLDRFDLVWSDNLVEPLAHAPGRVVLGGSFLWHDVLAVAHPGHAVIERYAVWAEDLLALRPMMTASRLFAMPAVLDRTAPVLVGLTPLVEPSAVRPTGRTFTVLLGANAHDAPASTAPPVVVSSLLDQGWTRVDRVEDAAVVVARAGLGAISDALARRAGLILLPDANPEIAHNRETALALGVAAVDLNGLEGVGALRDDELLGAGEIAGALRRLIDA